MIHADRAVSCFPVRRMEDQYDEIIGLIGESDEKTAVLYRDNSSALPLILRLKRAGIPFEVRGQEAERLLAASLRVLIPASEGVLLIKCACNEHGFALHCIYFVGCMN